MKKVLLVLLLAFGFTTAHAQFNNTCGSSTNYASVTLTASTQLVAAPANLNGNTQAIHICAFTIQISQTASPVTWGLTSGTGSACATGLALVTPAYIGTASAQQSIGQSYGSGNTVNLPASTALCLTLSGTPTGAVVHVTYAIY